MPVLVNGQCFLKVDAHAHILPREWPECFDEIPLRLIHYDSPRMTGTSGPFSARLEWKKDGSLFRELKANCFDYKSILGECDDFGVDVQVCCTVPVMFNYQLQPSTGVPWSQFLNDDLIDTCLKKPDRLVALGTLPMQCPESAVEEVRRAVAKGIRGFQVGSHINSFSKDTESGVVHLPLNHPSFLSIWKECETQGACLMVHPWDMHWCNTEYWQPWLVGMPSETTLAGTALILGGVLEKCPNLRIMMAHGGGALPYIIGRIDWGYRCRPDLVATSCPRMPSSYLRQLYVDSICHDEKVLHYLVDTMGPDRVMLGSDYPFPLGEVPSVVPLTGEKLTAFPGELIQNSSLNVFDKKRLLSDTALEWLGLDASHYLHHMKAITNKDDSVSRSMNNMSIPAPPVKDDDNLPLYVVDAFTKKPYAGNPAAVVLLPKQGLEVIQLQRIASQMNLSETAFVQLLEDKEGLSFETATDFGLRWFTPDGTEVNLCGHATLATATALANCVQNRNPRLRFHTLSGILTAERADIKEAKSVKFCLQLPCNPPRPISEHSTDVQDVAFKIANAVLDTSIFVSLQEMTADLEISLYYSEKTKKLVIVLPEINKVDSTHTMMSRTFIREKLGMSCFIFLFDLHPTLLTSSAFLHNLIFRRRSSYQAVGYTRWNLCERCHRHHSRQCTYRHCR
jgi:aminocarboxymuconate-semialdehyde decarboxylase